MSIIIAASCAVLALIFLILWIRERKKANDAEIVAYGLRAQDDGDENTKTNLTVMESEYDAAIQKLIELGEITRDDWGRWVWVKTGQQMSEH